jgi:hypothetical protein
MAQRMKSNAGLGAKPHAAPLVPTGTETMAIAFLQVANDQDVTRSGAAVQSATRPYDDR